MGRTIAEQAAFDSLLFELEPKHWGAIAVLMDEPYPILLSQKRALLKKLFSPDIYKKEEE